MLQRENIDFDTLLKAEKIVFAEDIRRGINSLLSGLVNFHPNGLDVETRRAQTEHPVGVPATRPAVQLQKHHALEHLIYWDEENSDIPLGNLGVEIWMNMNHPNETPKTGGFHFLAMSAKGPHLIRFSPEDAGKTASYILRWANLEGKGPWSLPVFERIL